MMLFLLVVILALNGFVHCQDRFVPVAQGRCGVDGWTQFGDGCYYHYSTPKAWIEARKTCQAYQSDLVCISSERENDFVAQLTEGETAWIGLRDEYPYADMTDPREEPEDQWMWTDTSPYQYTNWAEGQPSGYQDTVQINYDGRGKWDDQDYWVKQGFVCEKPQI